MPRILCLTFIFAAANGAADKGNNFADFYRQQQMQLFSAVDAELARQAQNAITDNFNAVKKAGVELQTKLGGRKANLGINLIGALDESADHAIGWQLRAFGGGDNTKGANAGMFFRAITNEGIFGVNAFVDYEDGDFGNFSRFGFGGEVQNRFIRFAANSYSPITKVKNVNERVIAFSREGYDLKLRIAVPNNNLMKAAIDYYRFEGEKGAAADTGLRYGAELHPREGFKIGLFYDSEAEKFGGDIAYSHIIGETPSRHSRANGAGISPDLFAAVSREYSQRIATVAIGPGIEVRITPQMTITNAMTVAAITTTTTNTIPGMITMTEMEVQTLVATRMASVYFTTRIDLLFGGASHHVVVTTAIKYLVTLPPASEITRPLVIITMTNLERGINNEALIVSVGNVPADLAGSFAVGMPFNFGSALRLYTLTIAEGSEEFISVTTTLTTYTTMTTEAVITETTMTMLAMTTNTTLTTYATTTITLAANSAMADDGIMPSIPSPIRHSSMMPLSRHFGFPRLRRENDDGGVWIPAFAGMTVINDGFPRLRRENDDGFLLL